MEVDRVSGADAASEALEPLLLPDEARHNLALGILATARSSPDVWPDLAAWVVREAGATVGGALRTPPHNLLLVRPEAAGAIDALAASIEDELPGVIGAVPEVDDFAGAWVARRPLALETRVDQRIYRLEILRPTPEPAGQLRLATLADRDIVLERFHAFADEVRHGAQGSDDDQLGQIVESRLRSTVAGVALWEDGGAVVSLAGFGGPTPNGIRIGPVHTPVGRRGKGYGTAVTAGVTRLLLERGHRFCFLYTDLANPTSNAIYARIGYEPVCDSREIAFVPRARAEAPATG